MNDYSKVFNTQLDRTIKLAGARWAIWVGIKDDEWTILLHSGLTKNRRKELEDHLWLPGNTAWIAGALSSGRVRSRKVHESPEYLGYERVYLFPNPETQTAIIVGGGDLTKAGQEFFKILALIDPVVRPDGASAVEDEQQIWPIGVGLEAAYDPERIYQWIFQVMSQSLAIHAGYLAVKMGNVFQVEACWNYDQAVLGSLIPIFSARELRLIQATLQGTISNDPAHFPEFLKSGELSFSASSFLCLPVLVGQRLIGIMVVASSNSPGLGNQDRERAAHLLERLAQTIENAIVLTDVWHHLHQLALLCELSSVATFDSEPAQITHRLARRLSRIFRTEQINIFLISSDGGNLRDFGAQLESGPLVVPISKSLLGFVVESGKPYRTGNVNSAPRFFKKDEHAVLSFLAAPLKYQGRIIGVIGLESLVSNAFTIQDEQLLVAIASQLAGIIEHARMLQETGMRAEHRRDFPTAE